ncbi:MAG: hypothetical protein U0V74_15300 [Chitinophagales bacterium]
MKVIPSTTKKIHISLIVLVGLLFSVRTVSAQAPQAFNYQAVARNSAGALLAQGSLVDVRFTLRDLSATGTVVYKEEHVSVAVNQFGLFSVEVGNGTPLQGSFSSLSWSTSKFLQVEFKLHNAGTYDDMGTTQLLSVPYSLVSQTALSSSQWESVGNNIKNANSGTVSVNGNLGVGTNTPVNKIQLHDSSGFDYRIQLTNQNTGATAGDGTTLRLSATNFIVNNQESTGTINLGVSGGNGVYIASNNNVGIGNNSPSTKLDVNGQVKISGGSPGAGKVLTSDANGLATWQLPTGGGATGATGSTGPQGVTGPTGPTGASYWAANVNEIYNLNSGNVGIGTPAPSAKLNVLTTAARAANFESNGLITEVALKTSNGERAEWWVNGNDAFFTVSNPAGKMYIANSNAGNGITISAANNIGVGNGNPLERLDVTGAIRIGNTASNTAGAIRFDGSAFAGYNGTSWVPFGAGSGDNWGTQSVATNTTISGNGTAGNPIGLAQQGATSGQVLKWNGSAWAPAADNAGGGALTLPYSDSYNGTGNAFNVYQTGSSGSAIYGEGTEAGLKGFSTTGKGIDASTSTGVAVLGNATSGTAASFTSNSGYALKVSGNLQIVNGTPAAGKFLKCTNTSGDATWDVLPSQTLSYTGASLSISGGNTVTLPWDNTGGNVTYTGTGNVGIGWSTPAQKLDVNGAIKIGTTTLALDGTIRYTGTDFEGRKAGSWVSLTGGGGGSSQWITSGNNIYNSNTGTILMGTSTSLAGGVDYKMEVNANAGTMKGTARFNLPAGNTYATGVYIIDNNNAGSGSNALQATSPNNTAINAQTGAGTAVYGNATSSNGRGIDGRSSGSGSIAGYFSATGGGYALVTNSGNVGLGQATPTEILHVGGRIRLDANTTATASDGTIRWNGSDFEGRKGGAWVSLTGGGGGFTLPYAGTDASPVSFQIQNTALGTNGIEVSAGLHGVLASGDLGVEGQSYATSGGAGVVGNSYSNNGGIGVSASADCANCQAVYASSNSGTAFYVAAGKVYDHGGRWSFRAVGSNSNPTEIFIPYATNTNDMVYLQGINGVAGTLVWDSVNGMWKITGSAFNSNTAFNVMVIHYN